MYPAPVDLSRGTRRDRTSLARSTATISDLPAGYNFESSAFTDFAVSVEPIHPENVFLPWGNPPRDRQLCL
jgi:hypothetical protein